MLAGAHDFILELPEGYDTVIDQDSGAISAGERQLITIARAFLSQPTILILDEATSALDLETEKRIQKALNRLSEGRTSLVIAHRPQTISDADRVLRVEGGQLVAA